jgi:hypothetical protein
MEHKPCNPSPRPAVSSLFLQRSAVCACPEGEKWIFAATSFETPICAVIWPRLALQVGAVLQSAVITLAKTSSRALCDQDGPFCLVPSAEGLHQGGDAAPSCRLCLIACNSRKFTQTGPTPNPLSIPEEATSRDR